MLPNTFNKQDKNEQAVIKRSSRKHEEEGHSSAWKVAFADFCLALMCLYLVLWVMAARQKEEIEKTIRPPTNASRIYQGHGVMPAPLGGVQGSLIDRYSTSRPEASADMRIKTKKNEETQMVRYETTRDLQDLARILASLSTDTGLNSNMQTIVTPHGLRVMLHDNERQGMFERGSAVPSPRFKELLRKIGGLFSQMQNQILIVGHTDSLQYASQGHEAFSNWDLSNNRAMAARMQLLAGNMPVNSILQVVGMADRAPLDAKNPEAHVNRRIELMILTSAQADAVAAMFGMPSNPVKLTEEASVVFPDKSMLQKLRDKIMPAEAARGRSN